MLFVCSVKRYLRPVHQFFRRILAPGARVTADVYAYMFLCDFLNFLVVIFGFAAFGVCLAIFRSLKYQFDFALITWLNIVIEF